MLQLHTDINYQKLYSTLRDLLQQTQSIFSVPQIVVPNHSVKIWLQQSLAKDFGVCSQIDFLMPLAFIWKNSQQFHTNPQDFNPFQKDVLSWLLLENLKSNKTPALSSWSKRSELQQWTAAQSLADAFVRYIQEEPHEFKSWQTRPNHWQADVWNQVIKTLGLESPLNILEKIQDQPISENIVIFFGVEQLTEYQFEFLNLYAKHNELHYLISNPCPEIYWFDTKSPSNIQRTRHFHPQLTEHLDVGHPLLSSLGQNKMSVFNAFLNAESVVFNDPISSSYPAATTLLESLREDIFELSEIPAKHIADSSIEVHACHNHLRQVEVIKDQVLGVLNNSKLSCKDIIVVAPDINKYKDVIHLVFNENHASSPNNLYYHIDRMQLEDSDYVSAIVALIESFSQEMTSKNLFQLLCQKGIYQKRKLQIDDLTAIKHWISESNIRSYYSKTHREEKNYTPTDSNTFSFGEDRWMTGFLAGNEDDTPLASVFGDFAGTETLFQAVFTYINDWYKFSLACLNKNQNPDEWGQFFKNLCLQFIHDEYDSDQQKQVFEVIERVFNDQPMSSDTSISFTLASQILLKSLKNQQFRPFGRMGVRFQSWENAFVSPAKVLILMGLDETVFPQAEPVNDFDIFRNNRQGLRRLIQGRDRNLFLTALTEDHEKLIITYQGFDSKTNDPLPPSPLVQELVDYLSIKTDQGFKVHQHYLQGFNLAYFNSASNKNSFNSQHLLSAEIQQKKNFQSKTQGMGLFTKDSDDLKDLNFNELLSFFKDPLSDFLSQQAEINLKIYDEPLREHETFWASGLDLWKLKDICFHSSLQKAQKTGLLTDNPKSQGQLQTLNSEIQPLKDLKAQMQSKHMSHHGENWAFNSKFWQNHKNSIQFFSLKEVAKSSKEICQSWLSHLFFSENKESQLHCLGGLSLKFKTIDQSKALQQNILNLWLNSRTQPWIFLPSASFRVLTKSLALNTFETYKKSFLDSNHHQVNDSHKYFVAQLNETDFLAFQTQFVQPMIDSVEMVS